MITPSDLVLLTVNIRDELSTSFAAPAGANYLFPKLSDEVGVTTPKATYTGFGARPGFKPLRDRMAEENLKQYSLTIEDQEYYDLVVIERKNVEDDATGQYLAEAKRIGEGLNPFLEQQVLGQLVNGRTLVGYDKVPYFYGQHKGGVLNAPGSTTAQSNLTNVALTKDNLYAGIATMAGFVDDKGNPFGAVPDLLLVGTANGGAAYDLLRKDVVGETYLSGTLQPVVSPYVPASAWMLLDTKNGAPVIRQKRTDIGENGLDLNDNIGSKDAWSKGEWEVGARVRYGFGLRSWWKGYGSFQ